MFHLLFAHTHTDEVEKLSLLGAAEPSGAAASNEPRAAGPVGGEKMTWLLAPQPRYRRRECELECL